MTTITVLHPGEMGAAVAAQAVLRGHRVLWVDAGRSAATRDRASAAGLEAVSALGPALGSSDVVLSICPPAYANEVARAVAAHGFRGIYVDANAISPSRASEIASVIAEAGGTPLDGSIIGPPPGGSTGARLYLSGDSGTGARVVELFTETTVDARLLDRPIGAASALKMAFASYQKTARTLVGLAHGLADEHGVTDQLVEEGKKMAGPLLADRDYLGSVARRAWRWDAEMLEIAAALDEANLPADLARATAEVLGRWAPLKDARPSAADAIEYLHTAKPSVGGHP
ncbi:DUF1932 domain-containing protein [Kitasatospora sp. NPDC098663]|uniref:NAD(P)-dependent oxidoreductase n=1 Tax=Kitasatospora sp. NPDC098663 TaxID=3364096 RepID=UPI00380ADEFD